MMHRCDVVLVCAIAFSITIGSMTAGLTQTGLCNPKGGKNRLSGFEKTNQEPQPPKTATEVRIWN